MFRKYLILLLIISGSFFIFTNTQAEIIISKVRPGNNGTADEFVELFNNSAAIELLSNYK